MVTHATVVTDIAVGNLQLNALVKVETLIYTHDMGYISLN